MSGQPVVKALLAGVTVPSVGFGRYGVLSWASQEFPSASGDSYSLLSNIFLIYMKYHVLLS